MNVLQKRVRASILNLHASLEKMPDHLTSDDFPLNHHFAPGVYVREMLLEKDRVVVGKIHRHDHIAMLIKGRAVVVSEQGRVEIEAPHIWHSKAGEKRAVYAIDDCIFVTVHPTDETDLEKIEEIGALSEKHGFIFDHFLSFDQEIKKQNYECVQKAIKKQINSG